ncbi:uncharacterized protein LOC128626067 [Artibeus jamaicensis]|uniref:uncharacterized protein LOC128626067 n=1 Tax=Artibeus jamaicensis TaxID=9417 RepID=UPI00235B21F7|nr:uncharacterized protein LOC128626067 [Artibeus jamaicensis]
MEAWVETRHPLGSTPASSHTPAYLTGSRPGPQGGGRSPGGASSGRWARVQAAAARLWSPSRGRRRLIAAPPPPAPASRPPIGSAAPAPPPTPLRFVFPALAVPPLSAPRPNTVLRAGHLPRAPRSLASRNGARDRGRDGSLRAGTSSGEDAWGRETESALGDSPAAVEEYPAAPGPFAASVSPSWPCRAQARLPPFFPEIRGPCSLIDPARAAREAGPVPVAPTPPRAAESSRRQGQPRAPALRPRKATAGLGGTACASGKARGPRCSVTRVWWDRHPLAPSPQPPRPGAREVAASDVPEYLLSESVSVARFCGVSHPGPCGHVVCQASGQPFQGVRFPPETSKPRCTQTSPKVSPPHLVVGVIPSHQPL